MFIQITVYDIVHCADSLPQSLEYFFFDLVIQLQFLSICFSIVLLLLSLIFPFSPDCV